MRAPFQVLLIPFRLKAAGPEYAILKRKDDGCWQFVAGGGEGEESALEAARRETQEEIGLTGEMLKLDSMSTVPKSCFLDAKSWPKDIFVIPEHCFAIDVGDSALTISGEHVELRWALYGEAFRLLKWDSNRTVLWELNERLKAKA
jgi:dATP pyrophosphohydrolase